MRRLRKPSLSRVFAAVARSSISLYSARVSASGYRHGRDPPVGGLDLELSPGHVSSHGRMAQPDQGIKDKASFRTFPAEGQDWVSRPVRLPFIDRRSDYKRRTG